MSNTDFVEIPILRVKEIQEWSNADAGKVLTIKNDGSLQWEDPVVGVNDAVNAAFNGTHTHMLADLTDVDLSGLQTGDALVWDGSKFSPVSFGGGDGVISVNGESGIVFLIADDIDDSGSAHKFVSADQLTKIDSVDIGAEANPARASNGELVAGSGTIERSFSPSDIKSMIDTHASGGSVDSVNSMTGAVVLNTDHLNEGTGNKFVSAAQKTKLDGIEAGAQVNPVQIDAAEIIAGTETAVRGVSPADVKGMIDTHGGGSGGGASTLDDLTDVDTTTNSATVGEGLVWDGTNWVPGTVSGGGGGDITTAPLGAIVRKTGSNQSSGNGINTVITFPTADYDSDAWWNGSRFQPTEPGWYELAANLTLSFSVAASQDNNSTWVYFSKNGSIQNIPQYVVWSEYKDRIDWNDIIGDIAISGNTKMYFNGTTDYAELGIITNYTYVSVRSGSQASFLMAGGVKGDTGAEGPQGPQGIQGLAGTDGLDGKTVLNGTVAPTTEGVDGDFYLKTDTMELYGPRTGGSWGSATSLVGPTGATGATGPAGADGQGVPTGGTTGQVLTKTDGTNFSTEWVDQSGGASALGDLSDVTSAGATAGQALVSDGAGNWAPGDVATGGSGGGTVPFKGAYATGSGGSQSFPNSTYTTMTICQNEVYDTNNWWDGVTGRFQPNEAGYYMINASITLAGGSSGYLIARLTKNGSENLAYGNSVTVGTNDTAVMLPVYLNGTTDYVTVDGFHTAGSTLNFGTRSFFTAYKIEGAQTGSSFKGMRYKHASGATLANNTHIVLSGLTTLDFDTTNSWFDGQTFQPDEPGYYQLNFYASIGAMGSSTGRLIMRIRKNGSELIAWNQATNTATSLDATMSHVVELNGTTDYVEVLLFHDSGTTANIGTGTAFSAAKMEAFTGPVSIGDLTNVDITTTLPTDGQALVWSDTLSAFVPGEVTSGGSGGAVPFKGLRYTYDSGLTSVSNFVVTDNTALGTKDFDTTNSWWDSATGRFQPDEEGYYHITQAVEFFGTGGLGELCILLEKNGSTISKAYFEWAQHQAMPGFVSEIVYLNGTTDYIEAKFFGSNGGNSFGLNDAAGNANSFSAYKIEGAQTGSSFKGIERKPTNLAQTISSGAYAVALWHDETYSTGEITYSNGVFTAQEAGYYQVNFTIGVSSGTNGQAFWTRLRRNSDDTQLFARALTYFGSDGVAFHSSAAIVYLDVGDTLEAQAYTPSGSPQVLGSSTLQLAKMEAFDGATSLDNMTDVDTSTTTPSVGDRLEWDGTRWVPSSFQGLRVKATHNNQLVTATNVWTDDTTMDLTEFDTLGGWNAGTGKWTCPKAGYYAFDWNACVRDNIVGGNTFMVGFHSSVAGELVNINQSEAPSNSGFIWFSLSATRYVELNEVITMQLYSYNDNDVHADKKHGLSIVKVG